MNGHIASLPRILAISEELIHELVECETALQKNTSLAILGEYYVGWIESTSRANSYSFFSR
jgi:hypothetical protein